MKATLATLQKQLKSHRTVIPIALALLMLLAAFVAGIRSGVATSIGFLDIDITGLTAALSSDAHGLKDDPYQGYKSVRDALRQHGLAINELNYPRNFRDYDTLTNALQAAANADVCGSPLVSQMYNDQGVIEFIHVAFWMFGIDVESLYYFYFVLLCLSVLAYLIVFWRSYSACALLFACVFAVYSFMPSVLYNNDQLISVSNTRFLSTLGIIPLLHILLTLAGARNRTITWTALLALLFQTTMVSFAIAVRSTSLWMEIAFILVALVYFAMVTVRAIRPGGGWAAIHNPLLSRGAVVLYVTAMFLMCSSARGFFLLPDCHEGLGGHTFWHNVFLGFGQYPGWRQIVRSDGYPISDDVVGDALGYDVAKDYVKNHHWPYQTEPSIFVANDQTRRIGEDPAPLGSWQTYERVMRRVVLGFMWAHPGVTIELFAIYKPLLLLRNLRDTAVEILKGLLFFKFLILALMIAVIGGAAPESTFTPGRRTDSRVFVATALVTAGVGALFVLLAVFFPEQFPVASWAFGSVLAVFLILAGVNMFLWWNGQSVADSEPEGIRFSHITAVLGFCFIISTAPLIAAYSSDYLIADQSFLSTAAIIFCLIWGVTKERSMARRRLSAWRGDSDSIEPQAGGLPPD